jgi:hypothetical protein
LGHREIIVDGVNANLCQFGPDTTRLWGIRAPQTAFTAADGGAGNVTVGDKLLLVVFAVIDAAGNTLRESAARLPALAYTAPGSKKIALTNLPLSDDDQVNARNIYMTLASGDTFYRAATIANNTATTYDLDVSDAALSEIEYSPANTLLPAKPCVAALNSQIVLGGDLPYSEGTVDVENGSDEVTFTDAALTRAMEGKSLAVAGSSTVYVLTAVDVDTQTAMLHADYQGATAAAQPYRLSHENSLLYLSNVLPGNIEGYNPLGAMQTISIEQGDGQSIVGLGIAQPQPVNLGSANGTLVVLKTKSAYVVRGTPTQYDVQPLVGAAGGVGPLAGITIDDGSFVWYAGAAGIYRYHPSSGAGKVTPPDLDALFADEINHERDPWAHMAWLPSRKWLFLWVTPAANATVPSLLLVGDFSRVGHDDDMPVRWWTCRLPATCSRLVTWQGNPLLLLGTEHGAVWGWELGSSEAADALVNRRHALTDVDADAGTLDVTSLGLPTGEDLAGVPVYVLTGAAAGQLRYIAAATDTQLTLDVRDDWGGPLDPAPAVGDLILIGAIASSWSTPEMTLASPSVIKRWHQTLWDFAAADGVLRLDVAADLGGQLRPRGSSILPAHRQARTVVPHQLRAQRAQFTLSSPEVQWTLRSIGVQAAGAGEVRP